MILPNCAVVRGFIGVDDLIFRLGNGVSVIGDRRICLIVVWIVFRLTFVFLLGFRPIILIALCVIVQALGVIGRILGAIRRVFGLITFYLFFFVILSYWIFILIIFIFLRVIYHGCRWWRLQTLHPCHNLDARDRPPLRLKKQPHILLFLQLSSQA